MKESSVCNELLNCDFFFYSLSPKEIDSSLFLQCGQKKKIVWLQFCVFSSHYFHSSSSLVAACVAISPKKNKAKKFLRSLLSF